MPTHAHTFSPVNGSVPPWPPDEVPLALEADEPEVPLFSVEGADCESGVLLVEDEEPLEDEELPELEELEPEPEPEDPLGCDVFEEPVPVSGSTYCWSPAEVLVPDASTAAAPARDPANRPARQASVRTTRRTTDIEPGRAEEGPAAGFAPFSDAGGRRGRPAALRSWRRTPRPWPPEPASS